MRNLAIVESADVDFDGGLNVITGEPGTAVTVAEGCPVQTANKDLRGEVAVDGEAVVVTLLTRRRFFLILR